MAAYYNEIDKYAAQWLRNLIADGQIAPGDVDTRPIQEVQPDDLKPYTQCHFFAGIGGWSIALRLAGWNDDRPVWTGSCPCQPFSAAGKKKGHSDERHLWPYWSRLIRKSSPPTIFGEQVASAITFGWWDEVAADLEAQEYSCAAAVLPACSVGKPHKRDRLWFVGNAQHDGQFNLPQPGSQRTAIQHNAQRQNSTGQSKGTGSAKHVADTKFIGRQGQGEMGESMRTEPSSEGEADWPLDDSARLNWINCPDGKQRPVEPSICLLAHGVLNRTPKLRGYGNAIVPQVAAEFIKATM